MLASKSGSCRAVAVLLDRETGLCGADGTTALMLAAQNGKTDCVRLLAEREGGMEDGSGGTALWYAVQGQREECCGVLERVAGEKRELGCRCGGARDLFEAAERGCCGCCRRTIGEAGRTRDDISLNGFGTYRHRTALMVAANNGKTGCVRILAKKEAGMRDGYTWTAMMMAAWQGHLGCVEILAPLEKGMKDDHWGRSARSWAELNGKQSCVDYLSRFPEE